MFLLFLLMIITITCNPAIDKTVIENNTSFTIGGKGINVSKALNNLNNKSIACGFLGKDNKDLVINDLDSLKIEHHFTLVDGKVRTNLKKIVDNELIENNEDGPYVDIEAQDKLLDYLSKFINCIFVISGSAPSSVDPKYYQRIIEKLKANNAYIIVDSDKDLLRYAIEAKPNVIKPNKEEICRYFNIEYDEDLIIKKCKELDIDLVVVSLGKDGSLFISKDFTYKVKPLEVNYVSSLCAGDSMVAGIAYSKENNLDINELIKLSVACASASVENVSIFNNKEEVDKFIGLVNIFKVL